MDSLTWLALGLIFLVIVMAITAIIFLHMIPGKIARRNHHPQAKAIEICSLMGLIIFPFWMVAYVWANYRPAKIFMPEVLIDGGIEPSASSAKETSPDETKQDSET